MAIEGAAQALIAAFSFGVVVNAASAALFLYVNGHGSALWRDGLRLVLVVFLLSGALWAQVGFIATVVDTTASTMPCQIGVIFTTLFDQVARSAAEQYLVWAVGGGKKMGLGEWIPQLAVAARFVAGLVFVGFSRPQVDSVCVPMSSMPAVAAAVVGLDALIVALLAARAFMTGLVGDIQESRSGAGRSKLVLLVMVGFAVWTGTSVVMTMGMMETDIIVRTTVPAIGLFFLILIVTGGMDALVTPRNRSNPPEAPSPRLDRDLSSADSDYPPTRYEDLKEQAIRSSTTFLQPREAPKISRDDRETPENDGSVRRPWMTGLGSLKRKTSERAAPKLAIGNPILDANDAHNPLNKIATMDLQEAARAERERRGQPASQATPPPLPTDSPEEALKRSVSFKRKEIASVSSQPAVLTPSAQRIVEAEPVPAQPPRQDTTPEAPPVHPSIRPSRQLADPLQSAPVEPNLLPAAQHQRRPTNGLPGNPRARAVQDSAAAAAAQQPDQRVMLVNDIVYDDPTAVRDIIEGASSRAKKMSRVPEQEVPEVPEMQEMADMPPEEEGHGLWRSASVVNRPRPIPRKKSEEATNHRRSRSGGSLIGRKSLLMSNPGSPTSLPPLPPPPKSAGGLPSRPQDKTKSMTVDEKMAMFFPVPPKGTSQAPALPPIPAVFLESSSNDHRRSNRTTRTSQRTESILDVEEVQRGGRRDSHRTDDMDGWMGGDMDQQQSPQNSYVRRGSSPVLPGSSPVLPSPPVSDDDTRPPWHPRLGEELPTFSDRKEKRLSARMPPPSPLSLHQRPRRGDVVLHAAEPSPVESPQVALRQIESQLDRLDRPEGGARLALLENLEREMGAQEDRWHEMQHDIARDSVSTVQTSPGRASMLAMAAAITTTDHPVFSAFSPSTSPSVSQERRTSYRSRMRSGTTVSGSTWQQRLADAQSQYMDSLEPDFVASGKVPTFSLWTPPTKSYPPSGPLWTPSQEPTSDDSLPALSVRPATRKTSESLPIHSARLWSKPHNTHARSAAAGLWRPAWAARQPSVDTAGRKTAQKPPRPLTQRPPRRNKRLTLLPDIVENPEPLPDKRDTLGIFQFPWGERSDTAQAQPTVAPARSTPSVMAMPGTMASGGLAARAALEQRARQFEQDEYSSFFDDYEEEEEEGDDDDDSEDGSEEDSEGDDFDETTLWEIASLLKTDGVPSKLSLLPQRDDDYLRSPSLEQSIVIGLAESVDRPSRSPPLWTPPKIDTAVWGLPQPDEESWSAYGGSVETVRAKPRKAEPAVISSDTLWTPDRSHGQDSTSPLWERMPAKMHQIPAKPAKHVSTEKHEQKQQQQKHKIGVPALWMAPPIASTNDVPGLYRMDPARSLYRTTSLEPAAKHMQRTPRPAERKPLDQLVSTRLWSASSSYSAPRNWIAAAANMGPIPVRRQFRRPLAYRADWDAALQEALAASYPPRRRRHALVAVDTDWAAALEEAIMLGGSRAAPAPVIVTAAPAPVIATAAPAVAPKPAPASAHDPAVRHPVFFGEFNHLEYDEAAVHPAMDAYHYAPAGERRSRRDRDRQEMEARLGALESHAGAAAAALESANAAADAAAADAFRTQIEVLEQERLFAEQAVQDLATQQRQSVAAAAFGRRPISRIPISRATPPSEPEPAPRGVVLRY